MWEKKTLKVTQKSLKSAEESHLIKIYAYWELEGDVGYERVS